LKHKGIALKKVASCILLATLLVSMFVLPTNIKSVRSTQSEPPALEWSKSASALQPNLITMPFDTANLPNRRAFKQAEVNSYSPHTSVSPEYISEDSGNVTDADLAETIEVQFTAEIRELAANLSYNPIKMYEYVLNNFDFEIYYGSLKGAQETLWEKAGNDVDLASLLIALYRVSGIPARYVDGQIAIPIEEVMNWVGVNDPITAADAFATGRVPSQYNVDEDGHVVSLTCDHSWVEAYVDYIPSRGAVNVAGDTWVNLDPSFKQYVYADGVNFTKVIPFDANAFVDQLVSTATVNQTGSYVTGVNDSLISSATDAYGTQVRSYLETNMPDATIGQVLGGRRILKKEYGILPATLPYDVSELRGEYSEVPDEYRHKVTFQLYDSYHNPTSFNYSVPTAELAGKRITLSYLGATPADEELIIQYVNETYLPAYLINLQPVLRIDGDMVANGSSVGMGNYQYLDLYITGAFEEVGETEPVEKIVFAGAYYAFGLDLQTMPLHLMKNLELNFENITEPELAVMKIDDFMGETLQSIAVSYFYMFDSSLGLAERDFKVIDLRDVAVAIVSYDINVTYDLFGAPNEARAADSFSFDMRRMVHSPFAVIAGSDVGGNLTRSFMLAEGYLSSSMESNVFEVLLSAYNVTVVSTVKVLQAANERGIPIFRVSSDNVDEILPQLQVNQNVKNDITDAVGQGMVVTVPKTQITIGNWTGSGYVVEDPVTGAASFPISGTLNGSILKLPLWLTAVLGVTNRILISVLGKYPLGWLGPIFGFAGLVINIAKAYKKILSRPDTTRDSLILALTTFGLGMVCMVGWGLAACFLGPVGGFIVGLAITAVWQVYLAVLDP
jgi:transglutaminase-like putative cysteine protease